MSNNIYGSSLRAAKSKANYFFEGDFRRRPNQNLSGASRSLARGELLQQAAEQRQNREDIRKKELAAIKIQSTWRLYRIRKILADTMRRSFDKIIEQITSNKLTLKGNEFDILIAKFVTYYHSKLDETRLNALIDSILANPNYFLRSKHTDPRAWSHRLTRLLKLNLNLIKQQQFMTSKSRHLIFLELYTRPNEILDESQAAYIWQSLIKYGVHSIFRQIISDTNENSVDDINDFNQVMISLIKRSLDIDNEGAILAFFKEFLKGPQVSLIEDLYLPELFILNPSGLTPKSIISAFESYCAQNPVVYFRYGLRSKSSSTDTTIHLKECKHAIWLCYSFVTTLYNRTDCLTDLEKLAYIKVLSNLLGPAEYITNMSLSELANTEEDRCEQDEELDDRGVTLSFDNFIYIFHTGCNLLIRDLIGMINQPGHINSLKSVILNSAFHHVIQRPIVQICNLMLAHKRLAIFNCRLLYTMAFSREFSRSLWKSIISVTKRTLFGATNPIYVDLTQGQDIDRDSWDSILPQLRLFCSLYSYLLPTIDDEDFYPDLSDKHKLDEDDCSNHNKDTTNSAFFVDRELINMSAILRDLCVGFIEILYQEQHNNQPSIKSMNNDHDHYSSKLLSFEIKVCFRVLVKLVCQLHARDSRKQFCPEGHWISPSVVIPVNKAIDFQLVTSQQGRLLRQMTKDNFSERNSCTISEIKTVLILQEIPFVIPFHDRVQILHLLLIKEKMAHHSEGYHFGLSGSAIEVQVRRSYIYEDAFEKLSMANEPNMKLPLKVSMINAVGADEAGIDGGGLSKEFLSELLKAGFDPMRGFFKSTKDHTLYPNPSAKVLFSYQSGGFEVHYEFLGRILGKAIFEKTMVELPLARFFAAKLLARNSSDVDIHNLASLDPILYKNLVYLKNYQGDVVNLNLDFTISNNDLDEHEIVELKPGGSKIPVTRENKIEYVHLVADYRLNKQIRVQCAAFKRGLSQLIDLDWLRMFDSREFQILISGAPTLIDINDWRQHTLYANGYSDDCGPIKTFWKVTNQFDESQKRKLLKFTTSCSLPPLLGFKDLVPQFTIAPSDETRLPTASTCMNLLKLPTCEDEIIMRTKLLYAIESNSGFELS